MKRYVMSWGERCLELGRRTLVMGILNVTPDSFSDGGLYHDRDEAVARGVAMAREGADIIDVGGESTRPFSDSVAPEEEVRRVVPVIEELSKRVQVPLSVDTTKAAVAEKALEAGACIVNDISALRHDPHMGELVARRCVPVVLMHMLGTPRTMQVSPHYDDVVAEIRKFLVDAVRRAEAMGVPRDLVMVDPGVGFGKTVAHNLTLLRMLSQLASVHVPLLVGPSRKSFLRKCLEKEGLDASPHSVELATAAAVTACSLGGAHVVRVHDVRQARLVLCVSDALREIS